MIAQALKLAFSLLTRIPVQLPEEIDPRAWGQAVVFYPLVGLVMGVILAAAAVGLRALNTPAELAAMPVLVLWVGLTGAFHLDGLADSADAWLGGYGDPERTLQIMKDPACGPAGAVALMLVLLTKWVALASVLAAEAWPVLLLTPVLARAAVSGLFLALPCAVDEGLVHRAKEQLPRARVAAALVLSVLAALLPGWSGMVLLLVTLALSLAGARLMMQRLGGFSGDPAGALVESVEALGLLTVALTL